MTTSSRRSSASSWAADRLAGSLALVLLAAPPAAAQQPPQPATQAIAAADSAAQAWFGALAAGAYGGSWQAASPLFKKRISELDWTTLAGTWREQFQRGPRRRLIESRYQETVPPQEPGEYVTLRYLTDLAPERPERRVFETVLLARDPAGAWRVADYLLWPNVDGDPVAWGDRPFVRPPPAPAPPAPPATQNVARPRP